MVEQVCEVEENTENKSIYHSVTRNGLCQTILGFNAIKDLAQLVSSTKDINEIVSKLFQLPI